MITFLYISLLCLSAALIALALVLFRYPDIALSRFMRSHFYRRPKNLSELNQRPWLTREDFGQLEKDFPDLNTVIVISNKVDQPQKGVAAAVIDNFCQDICYKFFVSQANDSATDVHDYKELFRHLYEVSARMPQKPARSFDDLFSIKKLPIEWDDVPYVFYVYAAGGNEQLLALKGNQPGVGIASGYVRVAEPEAKTIISLVSATSTDFGKVISRAEEGLISIIPQGVTTATVFTFPAAKTGDKPSEAA